MKYNFGIKPWLAYSKKTLSPVVQMGEDGSSSYKPNVTGKPELAEGWRLNLSAFPLKRAPHAEWNN